MTYKRALTQHTQVCSKCHIWTGSHEQHGYGIIYVTFRGKRKIALAHRLRFYVETMVNSLPYQCDVSHRCHTKTWLFITWTKKEKIWLEKSCKAYGICQGNMG